MADIDYHPFPETEVGGNIAYVPFVNNQAEITNLNSVEWANVLSNPFKTNSTNDIIYRGNRVGIGLEEGQSPINKLHLIGDLFITENYDTWDFLRFYHNGDTAFLDFGGVENGVSFRMNNGTTSFQDNPTMNEVMRFRDNKIGILKNNPGYSLDVNGSINSTSLYINEIDINTVINTLIDDRNYLTIASASTTYLTSSTASSTYATITNLNTKENALTFSAPLTRTTNTISLDLSAYDTIALRNTALGSYLTTATASSTYATITNLNTKENALTFSAPLTRTVDTISLDTSTYITTTNANALNSRFFNNNGNNHETLTNFNSVSQFGYNFIQGNTNGPGVNAADQYYSWSIGLGAQYGFGTYSAQFALPRNVASPYLCVRYQEASTYGGWKRISAGFADSAAVAGHAYAADTASSVDYSNIANRPSFMKRIYYNNAPVTPYYSGGTYVVDVDLSSILTGGSFIAEGPGGIRAFRIHYYATGVQVSSSTYSAGLFDVTWDKSYNQQRHYPVFLVNSGYDFVLLNANVIKIICYNDPSQLAINIMVYNT